MMYQSKLAQNLDRLYREWDIKLRDNLAYLMLSPGIPTILEAIDGDPELREKIVGVLKLLLEGAEEEDAGDTDKQHR